MRWAPLLLVLAACGGPVADGALAWERGEHDRALVVWKEAAASGHPSGVLLYDLGIGWYRAGDVPRAVAAWRAARTVRPRDARVMHNLAFARAQLEGTPNPAPLPVAWLEIATPGEVGLLGAALLVVAAVGAWSRRGLWPWVTAGVVGVVLGGAAVRADRLQERFPVAVVVDGAAPVRDVPSPSAPAGDPLPPGSELTVLAESHGFLLVERADGGRGWVTEGAVLVASPDRVGEGG
jgi:hypothetical protein